MRYTFNFFYHLRSLLVVISILTIWPICFFPIYIYHRIVLLIVRIVRPNFGKIFTPVDILVEDCIEKEGNVPNCSLVSSMELEGAITLEELRSLFQRNVLERWASPLTTKNIINNNSIDSLRYPELKQYPVSFMGYKFWKPDPKFDIKDHIIEAIYNNEQPNLSSIHQDMINKSYIPRRSPWELVLINNYRSDADLYNQNSSENKALIIARFHHSLADAKSILKLFVECLGNQSLSTAQPQPQSPTRDGIILTVVKYIVLFLTLSANTCLFWTHPWKIKRWNRARSDLSHQVVRLSPKLCLKDILEVGKKSGGTGASVILAIISGSIQRVRPDIGELYSIYILPKDNHPETLCNHASFGSLLLPTGEDIPRRRLHKCHSNFKKLKASNVDKFLEPWLCQLGKLFNPVRRIFVREMLSTSVVAVTNIAGEAKGFAVGGRTCSEFILSVGTLTGDTGIVFCANSYRDYLRIAVISKGGVLEESESEKLASAMEKELNVLRKLCY